MARFAKDKNGLFYTVIELKRDVGSGRRRKFIRAKTVALLKEKIATYLIEQEDGNAPQKAGAAYTVLTWVREWLRGAELRGKVTASTLKRYKSGIATHVEPALGKIALKKLTLNQVQQFIDSLIEKGLAPQTVRNTWIPLKQALDAARKQGLTKINTLDIELPALRTPDLYQISVEEMRHFLASVEGDRFEVLYWLAALGFREGELLAILKTDIDHEKRQIRISRGAQRVDQKEGKSKLQFIETKSEAGWRIVRLPQDWYDKVCEQLARVEEYALVTGWKEHGLLFPSTKGTLVEPQNLVNRYFKPALTKAGLPSDRIRFHDIRHAAASMFIALGYDPRAVADLLGHTNPAFTLKQYARSFAEQRERAVLDLSDLLRAPARVLEIPPKKQEQTP